MLMRWLGRERKREKKEWVGASHSSEQQPAAGEKLGHYLTVSGRVGRLCSGTRPGPGVFWCFFWQRVQGKGEMGPFVFVLSRLVSLDATVLPNSEMDWNCEEMTR